MLGVSWRWLRDHAEALGLTILRVDSKPFVDARAAFEAIRQHGTVHEAPADEHEPTLDEVLASMGKRRLRGIAGGNRAQRSDEAAGNNLNHSGSVARRGAP